MRSFIFPQSPFLFAFSVALRTGAICAAPMLSCSPMGIPRRPPLSFRRTRSTLCLRARAILQGATRLSFSQARLPPTPAALVSSESLDARLARARAQLRGARSGFPSSQRQPRSFRRTLSTLCLRARNFAALEAVVFLPGRTPRRPPRSLRRTRSTLGSRARAQLRGARSGFPSSQRPPRSFRRARSTLCLRARPILRRARRGPRLPPPFESVPRSGTKLVPLRFPKQRTKGYARCGCEGSLHPIKRTAQSSGYVLAI